MPKSTVPKVETLTWKRCDCKEPNESRWESTDGEWLVRNQDTTVKTRYGGEWDVYRDGVGGMCLWATTNTLKDGKRIAQSAVDQEKRELERIKEEKLE